jgi:hypothetical protein
MSFAKYLCGMILYNVTVNIDTEIHQEWLEWMKAHHIPRVIATGCFQGYKILKLLTEIENGGTTYTVQYFLNDLSTYDHYSHEYAPALQREHSLKYEGRVVAFRTLLEEIA